MPSAENKSLVRRFLKAWSEGADPEDLEEFVSDAAIQRYRSSLIASRILRSFAGFHARAVDLIADRDLVVARLSWGGTHRSAFSGFAPTGRSVEGQAIQIFRLRAGLIVETWESWDLGGLLASLARVSPEPILDGADIQGNILPGFNKDHQQFLFCQISNLSAARRWLGRVAPLMATLDEVASFSRLFKATRHRRRFEGTVKSTWMNIAFTYPGLAKLVPDAVGFAEAAFREGLSERSALLGDPAGSPQSWVVGGPGKVPDFVLILGSDTEGDMADLVSRSTADARNAFRVIWNQQGSALPGSLAGHEPFGFRDGISQPGVRGRLSPDPQDFLTPRENPDNPDEGKPGQELCAPGEFLFGYPDTTLGSATPADGQTAPGWARNGSFLVIRRLRQDVEGFASFLRSAAASLASKYPPLSGLSPERLGALMMGRWGSGAPLLRAPKQDDPRLGGDSSANNDFRFVSASSPGPSHSLGSSDSPFLRSPGDPLGLVCPHAAHIRKVNPRDDLDRAGALTARHRMLRRGIPYSDDNGRDRGLMFVSYQRSIEGQFEFVLRHWANNPDFRNAGEGFDPIVGQAPGRQGRTFAIPMRDPSGEIRVASIELPRSWTVATGGGYFFSPSIRALELFAQG